MLDIRVLKVYALSETSSQKSGASRHKRKARNRLRKMQKILPMFCPGHLREPGTRRSIVSASFSPELAKGSSGSPFSKPSGHPRAPPPVGNPPSQTHAVPRHRPPTLIRCEGRQA